MSWYTPWIAGLAGSGAAPPQPLGAVPNAVTQAQASWLERYAGGSWQVLGAQVGLGALLGFAVGYATKFALRLALLLVGVAVLLAVYLSRTGFLTVHWDALQTAYDQYVLGQGGVFVLLKSWASSLSGYIPISGGFVLGFLLGFRAG